MERNPKTGETLVIKAKTHPTFKAGEAFVDALNSSKKRYSHI
jgi:nucleoid DNA-binding protein